MNEWKNIIQGGQAKVRPTYIFDGNIWMHRWNSIFFVKCDNSNSGTHLDVDICTPQHCCFFAYVITDEADELFAGVSSCL